MEEGVKQDLGKRLDDDPSVLEQNKKEPHHESESEMRQEQNHPLPKGYLHHRMDHLISIKSIYYTSLHSYAN